MLLLFLKSLLDITILNEDGAIKELNVFTTV